MQVGPGWLLDPALFTFNVVIGERSQEIPLQRTRARKGGYEGKKGP
jgi:hypothetical protein